MKTAELVRNDNVYRAIGGKCWYATFENVRTEGETRYIRPCVLQVEIVATSSPTAVYVRPVNGQGRIIAARECLFDDRGRATEQAEAAGELLDGMDVRGAFTYRLVRKKAAKPKAPTIECRVRQVGHDSYVVQMRHLETRRWSEVRGLGTLTRWKANDTAKRIREGRDVPGYWRMPEVINGVFEFCGLWDYEV